MSLVKTGLIMAILVAFLAMGVGFVSADTSLKSPPVLPPAAGPGVLAASGVVTVQNDYLQIAVDSATSQFTLGNTGGDPANPNDDNRILLFGHPTPWSSLTTVRIDGNDYLYGGSGGTYTEDPAPYLTYIKGVWVSNDIQVTQTVGFVNNPATGRVDTMQIRYMLENTDPADSHTVGLRVLLDTMLGSNDGAPFQVPNSGAVTTEHEYTPKSSVPDYWQAFDSLENPTVLSQGTFRGGVATPPDRTIFVSWPDFYDTMWDYPVTPGKIFGTISYPDSAVGLYWDPIPLGPGQRIEYVSYYGISGLSQSMIPPLTLSVTGPLSLDVVNNQYSPNPFTVTAYVQAVSIGTIEDVSLTLDLPAGLTLAGSPATQDVGDLGPNEIKSVSWSVQAANQANAQLFTYEVTATSVTPAEERVVTRSILVPPLSLVYDTTFRSNPNGYQFPNFVLADLSWALFRDTYGADEVEINGMHRPVAENFYNNNYRYIASGGSCFGMASSSLVLYQNSYHAWDVGTPRTVNLPAWPVFPTFLTTATDWVEYYHTRQADAACQADMQEYYGNTVVYNELKNRMASGNWELDPMVLGFFILNDGGHAVVPYRIEESADHQTALIRVYDNNMPNQERTIKVNLTADTAWSDNYGVLTLVGISLSAIQQEPQMGVYDTVTQGSHLIYTDTNGNQMGYLNGEFVDNIDGAYQVQLLEAGGSNFHETYSVGNLMIKRDLLGTADGITQLSIARPGGLALIIAQVSPGSDDEIQVPPDGGSVQFTAGAGTSSLELVLDRENDESARQASVYNFAVENGGTVQLLFPPGSDIVGFINKGTAKEIGLTIENIGFHPGRYVHPDTLPLSQGSANWFIPADWNNLDHTYIRWDQDADNDGDVDNTDVLTPIGASVNMDPDTLQVKSKGNYVTAYIQLPAEYDIQDVQVNSVRIVTVQGQALGSPIGVVGPSSIGDYNRDGIGDLMVKFDRKTLVDVLTAPSISKIEVLGMVSDGSYFSGTDTVRVI
jgi:hypothetical protein